MSIANLIFILVFIAAVVMFSLSVRVIIQNIKLGRSFDISDNKSQRWKTMFLVAIGQSKMVKRPLAGILHIAVYLGFIIVNVEMLEILIDGVTGTHRIFSYLPFYNGLINVLEMAAVAVITACIIFLLRRNVVKVKRFHNSEMTAWPRLDANIILITEILLMFAFLSMNAADQILQTKGLEHYHETGRFLVSSLLIPLYDSLSVNGLIFVERFGWWFHIIGVLAFLNYIPYSKHFHVFLAFPNVWFSKLKPRTYIYNMESVTQEVKIAMGLIPDPGASEDDVPTFGAKDVRDLTWKSLMDSYTCTECGRCTAVCPANLTGKKLSPRKIIMDTRDRLEIVGKNIRKNGKDFDDGKALLGEFISAEEVWACTTCNACTYECPVTIDHVAIIMELRRYIFMEESAAPSPLNAMSTNIENNGAPWQYPAADRYNWANDLYINEDAV